MKKKQLEEQLARVKAETKEALETIWANVNPGQKKQIIKLPEIRELFDRYGVTE